MERSIIELAKIIRNRDNSNTPNYVIGKIISPYPKLKISDGDSIVLDDDQLIVSYSFSKLGAKTGDRVIMVPSKDEQTYVVLDKVV